MNQSLKYFPLIKLANGQYKDCKPMPEDEICEIINIAKKPEWTATIVCDGLYGLYLLLSVYVISQGKKEEVQAQ